METMSIMNSEKAKKIETKTKKMLVQFQEALPETQIRTSVDQFDEIVYFRFIRVYRQFKRNQKIIAQAYVPFVVMLDESEAVGFPYTKGISDEIQGEFERLIAKRMRLWSRLLEHIKDKIQ